MWCKPGGGDRHHRCGSCQSKHGRSPTPSCTAPCTGAVKLKRGKGSWCGAHGAVSWSPLPGKNSSGCGSQHHRRAGKYAHKNVSWCTSRGRALGSSHRHSGRPVCGHTWAGEHPLKAQGMDHMVGCKACCKDGLEGRLVSPSRIFRGICIPGGVDRRCGMSDGRHGHNQVERCMAWCSRPLETDF